MAARKKTPRTKTARKAVRKATKRVAGAGRGSALDRFERELPPNLREFTKLVRAQLGRLEKEITRQQATYRREAARVLREASEALGRIEAEGEGSFRRLTAPARRNLQRLMGRIQRAIEPAVKSARASARKARKTARQVRHRVEEAASDAVAAVTGDSGA